MVSKESGSISYKGSLSTQCNTGTICNCPVSAEAIFPMKLCKLHGDASASGAKGKPSGQMHKVILNKWKL